MLVMLPEYVFLTWVVQFLSALPAHQPGHSHRPVRHCLLLLSVPQHIPGDGTCCLCAPSTCLNFRYQNDLFLTTVSGKRESLAQQNTEQVPYCGRCPRVTALSPGASHDGLAECLGAGRLGTAVLLWMENLPWVVVGTGQQRDRNFGVPGEEQDHANSSSKANGHK